MSLIHIREHEEPEEGMENKLGDEVRRIMKAMYGLKRIGEDIRYYCCRRIGSQIE